MIVWGADMAGRTNINGSKSNVAMTVGCHKPVIPCNIHLCCVVLSRSFRNYPLMLPSSVVPPFSACPLFPCLAFSLPCFFQSLDFFDPLIFSIPCFFPISWLFSCLDITGPLDVILDDVPWWMILWCLYWPLLCLSSLWPPSIRYLCFHPLSFTTIPFIFLMLTLLQFPESYSAAFVFDIYWVHLPQSP